MQDIKLAFTPHQGDAFVIALPWQLDFGHSLGWLSKITSPKKVGVNNQHVYLYVFLKVNVQYMTHFTRNRETRITVKEMPSRTFRLRHPLSVYYII